MSFTIPDKGEGASNIQSIYFQEYWEVFQEALQGKNLVLSGCAVSTSSLLTVAIAKGAVLTNGILKAVASTTKTLGTADATNPRLDLIVVDSSGTVQVRAGTAAAAPKPPARTADDVVLAVIYVPALLTTVVSGDIVDLRALRENGPICIYRTTTQEVTDTTASAVHILDKTNSGVTIPNGLFLQGRKLRVRIGGRWHSQLGSPKITLTISYGGTTLFADTGSITTSDADWAPFAIDFDLTAVTSASQALNGNADLNEYGSKTAPTTGEGDIGSSASFVTPIRGTASVDSDSANRVLAVTLTWSASNAAYGFTVDTATVELI